MPALSIATSAPVPMAMPTSAAASAGASLTPSPAIATTRPSRRSFSITALLAVGQHLGLDLGDAELSRHRHRGGAVVAGQHDDGDAVGLQRCERLRGAFLHRIGDGDDARGLAVDGDEDRGRALAAEPLGLLLKRLRRDVQLAQKPRVAEDDAAALHHADRALAARRIEAAHRQKLDLALGGRFDDGLAERMLAAALDAGREPQHFGFIEAIGRLDRDDLRLAFGQGAGLVEDERVDRLHALQRLGVLDQHAARARRGRRRP